MKVGDKVKTKFTGQWTIHEITDVDHGHACESGIAFRVKPGVRGSGGVDWRGNRIAPETAWFDSHWFTKIE